MTNAERLPTSRFSHIGFVLLFGAIAFGLTGCYTQLQVAERPSKTKKHQVEKKATYADEYRREYRRTDRRAQKTATGPQYNYYFYGDAWDYDPFFHDPFFYNSWGVYPRYRSSFSLSFHFGDPYFRSWRYHPRYSWYHRGYGPGGYPSYGNYFFGDQYYYYGDAPDVTPDRSYGPRGATIGRGAVSADRRTTARSVRRSSSGSQSNARVGRIGRSREDARTARADRSTRVDRTRSSTRIGRSSRSGTDRQRATQRTRSRTDRSTEARSRTESRDRSSRTQARGRSQENSSGSNGRSRSRSGGDSGNEEGQLRSQVRPSNSSGRIGQRAASRRFTRSLRQALPRQITVPSRYDEAQTRLRRQRTERRSYDLQFDRQRATRSFSFENGRTTRSQTRAARQSRSNNSTQRRATNRSSSSNDQAASRRSSSSRSGNDSKGRSRSRGGDGR